MREILSYIIRIGVTAVIAIITAVISYIKKNCSNKKIRDAAVKISQVVENLYKDCGQDAKLKAFKDLCKSEKVNVDKAVKFLEDYIIPISKGINTYMPAKEEKPNGDDEVA